ncbi:MAG: membrane integrity-associated transporter subunit PqiC [Methylobacteriaceae bacterium]|nr:membrane integrity-associated transporter subunit PqiC [Methylobacteriaceae bacterium]
MHPRARRPLAAALVSLGLAAAGCSSPPLPAFDLTAPREALRGGVRGQLVVVEPVGIQPFESERIVAKDPAGTISYLGGAQWADRLPRLVQAKIIQTFENSSRIRAVGRPGDGTTPTAQLTTEIRSFQLDAGAGEVEVEISAKLIAIGSGRIETARIFRARVPVGSANGPEVAQALDRALSTVLVDLVRWTGTGR